MHCGKMQVRERVAFPTVEVTGSTAESYIQEAIKTFQNPGGFNVGTLDEGGSPTVEEGKVWRTYSTFNPATGERRSANTILNLDQENLVLRANTEVTEILFDGDLGVPFPREGDIPRARCIRTGATGLFTPEQIICVRKEGRIYITAGTILSTALLLKSGVGPGRRNVDNAQVRQTRERSFVCFLALIFRQTITSLANCIRMSQRSARILVTSL